MKRYFNYCTKIKPQSLKALSHALFEVLYCDLSRTLLTYRKTDAHTDILTPSAHVGAENV